MTASADTTAMLDSGRLLEIAAERTRLTDFGYLRYPLGRVAGLVPERPEQDVDALTERQVAEVSQPRPFCRNL